MASRVVPWIRFSQTDGFPFNRGLLGPIWVKIKAQLGVEQFAVSAPWMLIPSPKKWPSTTRWPFFFWRWSGNRGLTGRW